MYNIDSSIEDLISADPCLFGKTKAFGPWLSCCLNLNSFQKLAQRKAQNSLIVHLFGLSPVTLNLSTLSISGCLCPN